jgi:hypothetical protein
MRKIGLLLFVAISLCPLLYSQATIGSAQAIEAVPNARVITLGNSVVALDDDWKFQPGDSPWVNGSPLWAQPDYDDSHWAAMDLTPKAGSVDLMIGTSGFVPGWTKRGYPNLSGYAWYRLRLKVTDPAQPLRLKMPSDVDDAYQVYANGRYVGQLGGFSRNRVRLYYAKPLSFALPAPGPDGEIALAVRFYMSPSTDFNSPDAGGMHAPPMLGQVSSVRLLQGAEDDANLHSNFGPLQQALIFLLIAPLALWAWFYNRRERAWLWLFLTLACDILYTLEVAVGNLSFALTAGEGVLLGTVFFGSLILPLWTMFWWSWFGLRKRRWIPAAVWALTAALVAATFCANAPYLGLRFLPLSELHWFNAASVWCGAGVGVLLAVILIEGFRRDRTEALLAMVPILLAELTSFQLYLFATFDLPYQLHPFGLGISVGTIADILMVLVITALALRRFVQTQVRDEVERKAIARDLEQARELQQHVLVPEPLNSPGFDVETVYRPAQTVGGDFFQTLARPDGTLLVVIGDVSGKGVSAAMLVAVLVGAIRNQVETNYDPAAMLATLNRRLLGRSGGHFATCLAAEIAPDGTMRIANAGHIPPYLNGREMEVEGSLPLGVIAEVEYGSQIFKLSPGDRLTFITDGVLEATNEAKELFGFERTREVSGERAAVIVERARSFGQEDDITVVGVQFSGVAAAV